MTDKILGMMFIVIIFAIAAITMLGTYQVYKSNQQMSDTYGDAFGNKTNTTTQVENQVAPINIQVSGYLPLLAAVLVIFGSVFLLGIFLTKGGGGLGHRAR
jgi:hypothetical protein